MHEAIICRITVTPHPDPEVHSIAVGKVLGGEKVIVGKDTRDQELGIYFPPETRIGKEFAEKNDLIRRKDEDGKPAGGFFEPNRRVRIQKFRGVESNGFWAPLELLHNVTKEKVKEGDYITTLGGILICDRYTPRTNRRNSDGNTPNLKKQQQKLWFPEHKDTEQLRYKISLIPKGSSIVVTGKIHGCVSFDTLVETLEFGKTKIGPLVQNQTPCHIKGHDIASQEDVYSKVSDFYHKPDDGEWFEIELENGQKLEITGNNPVWLPELHAYRRTDELKPGDVVLVE